MLRTDKQTDRQTDRFAISIPRVSMLTRDKNRHKRRPRRRGTSRSRSGMAKKPVTGTETMSFKEASDTCSVCTWKVTCHSPCQRTQYVEFLLFQSINQSSVPFV